MNARDRLFNGSQNSVTGDFHSSYNGQAGVIVRNSPDVRLFNFSSIGNGESGVWFDHSNDGTTSTASAADNAQYRIWFLGSSRNVVIITITHNDGNPDHHDMVDLNSNCGTNIWYKNTGSGNQSCVKSRAVRLPGQAGSAV